MFDRWVEDGLLETLERNGVGAAVYSPLAQGLLTNKYLDSIPDDSRAAKAHGFLQKSAITSEKLAMVKELNQRALARGQSLVQMAIAWLLKDTRITSVIIGASKVSQVEDAIGSLENLSFTPGELEHIETILNGEKE